MARGTTQPKADQPLVSTASLGRAEKSPSLQYRNQSVPDLARGPKQRNIGRAVRN